MSKKIPLSNGDFVIVDDDDYPYLSRFPWRLNMEGNPVRSDMKAVIKMTSLLMRGKQNHEIAHKNNDRTDCRKENLYYASHSHQAQRKKAGTGRTSSRYRGVSFDDYKPKHVSDDYIVKKPWRAKIRKGKIYNIGRFATEEEAARAYDKKARELYGDFAYQNLPDEGEKDL